MSKLDKQLRALLLGFGYDAVVMGESVRLVSLGVRGFCSDSFLPWRFRSVFDAAEHLIPVIGDDGFARGFEMITKQGVRS